MEEDTRNALIELKREIDNLQQQLNDLKTIVQSFQHNDPGQGGW